MRLSINPYPFTCFPCQPAPILLYLVLFRIETGYGF